MIVLDTNIISELMKPIASQDVVTWLNQQTSEQLYTTSISLAEIHYGIQVLSNGKRQRDLIQRFKHVIDLCFTHRILNFDSNAAVNYGKLMAYRRQCGKPMNLADGQIAAITLTHRYSLATHNVKDFTDCGLTLIDPFTQ